MFDILPVKINLSKIAQIENKKVAKRKYKLYLDLTKCFIGAVKLET